MITAEITEFSMLGIAKMRFNSKMKTNVDITQIDDSIIQIYVKPYGDWNLDQDSFDPNQTLNLTSWKV